MAVKIPTNAIPKTDSVATPRRRAKAKGVVGIAKGEAVGTNALSQKRLLYLAKVTSPPPISDEPADPKLAVRRPVRARS